MEKLVLQAFENHFFNTFGIDLVQHMGDIYLTLQYTMTLECS